VSKRSRGVEKNLQIQFTREIPRLLIHNRRPGEVHSRTQGASATIAASGTFVKSILVLVRKFCWHHVTSTEYSGVDSERAYASSCRLVSSSFSASGGPPCSSSSHVSTSSSPSSLPTSHGVKPLRTQFTSAASVCVCVCVVTERDRVSV